MKKTYWVGIWYGESAAWADLTAWRFSLVFTNRRQITSDIFLLKFCS